MPCGGIARRAPLPAHCRPRALVAVRHTRVPLASAWPIPRAGDPGSGVVIEDRSHVALAVPGDAPTFTTAFPVLAAVSSAVLNAAATGITSRPPVQFWRSLK